MKLNKIFIFLLLIYCSNSFAQTAVKELDLWNFSKGDKTSASQVDYDDSDWESITLPHDWAIYGPFDKEIDKQVIKIEQNNEIEATEKTGRTGSLPFTGVAWYRTTLDLSEFTKDQQALIAFDGAMSNAEVFNGQLVVLVQSSTQAGDIELTVSGDRLTEERITISSLK